MITLVIVCHVRKLNHIEHRKTRAKYVTWSPFELFIFTFYKNNVWNIFIPYFQSPSITPIPIIDPGQLHYFTIHNDTNMMNDLLTCVSSAPINISTDYVDCPPPPSGQTIQNIPTTGSFDLFPSYPTRWVWRIFTTHVMYI